MNVFFIAFLLIPLIALSAKKLFGWNRSIWLIFFAWIPLGWMLWLLFVWLSHQQLAELVESTPNPPDELLDRLLNDGAANVFALVFGWAIAAIYFLVCLVVVNILREIKGALRKKSS
ncbi:MAG: hypothetical protein ACKVRN_01715 [Pyrinomonadaceae bacterium]